MFTTQAQSYLRVGVLVCSTALWTGEPAQSDVLARESGCRIVVERDAALLVAGKPVISSANRMIRYQYGSIIIGGRTTLVDSMNHRMIDVLGLRIRRDGTHSAIPLPSALDTLHSSHVVQTPTGNGEGLLLANTRPRRNGISRRELTRLYTARLTRSGNVVLTDSATPSTPVEWSEDLISSGAKTSRGVKLFHPAYTSRVGEALTVLRFADGRLVVDTVTWARHVAVVITIPTTKALTAVWLGARSSTDSIRLVWSSNVDDRAGSNSEHVVVATQSTGVITDVHAVGTRNGPVIAWLESAMSSGGSTLRAVGLSSVGHVRWTYESKAPLSAGRIADGYAEGASWSFAILDDAGEAGLSLLLGDGGPPKLLPAVSDPVFATPFVTMDGERRGSLVFATTRGTSIAPILRSARWHITCAPVRSAK